MSRFFTNKNLTTILAFAFSAIALVCASMSPARAEIVLAEGHVDIAAVYTGGNLQWVFNADGATSEGGQNLEGLIFPSQMTVRIPDVTNQNSAPPGSNSALTGYSGSGPFFWLPSAGAIGGAPFLGWSYDVGGQPGGIDIGDWAGNQLVVDLISVTAPQDGYFSMWVGGANPRNYMSTFNPALTNAGPRPNSFALPSHNHFNWGFTEEGVYDLTLRVSGTHLQDGFKSSDSRFRFLVGSATAIPEPGTGAVLLAGFCLIGCRVWRKRRQQTQLP